VTNRKQAALVTDVTLECELIFGTKGQIAQISSPAQCGKCGLPRCSPSRRLSLPPPHLPWETVPRQGPAAKKRKFDIGLPIEKWL